MCLDTRQLEAKVARKDIIVYKVLLDDTYEFNGNEIRRLTSPFRNAKWKQKVLTKSEMLDKSESVYTSRPDSKNRRVEVGLHSYGDLSKALSTINRNNKLQVFEAVIPKGTKYFKGTFNSGVSYCSKELILGKKLTRRAKIRSEFKYMIE